MSQREPAARSLMRALGQSRALTPDEAQKAGYVAVAEYAEEVRLMRAQAAAVLRRGERSGVLERVRLTGGGGWAYRARSGKRILPKGQARKEDGR